MRNDYSITTRHRKGLPPYSRKKAEAVADQFDVKVSAVKTLVQQGKSVRFSRGKNRYPGTTKRKDTKKAYVTLAKGSSIQVFEEPAAEEEKK